MSVGLGHRGGMSRSDGLSGADGGLTGSFDRGPGTDAGAGEEGCTEGTAFLGFEEFNGVVVDVGLDLPPERTAGTTATEADAVVGDTELGKEGEGVLEREGDTFKDSADEVSAGGRCGDADEGGADGGVEVGSAFSEEVRRPEETIGGGWDVGGEGGEVVVGVERKEGVFEVAEAEAGAVGHAHDVPDAGCGVAKGVEAALGVKGGGCSGGENHAGGADGGGDRAGSEDAHADGASALIACASGDGGTCGESCGRGAGVGDAGADLWAFEEGWEPGERDTRGLGDFGGPAAMDNVEEQGSGGLLHVHGVGAGHAVADVVLGTENVGDFGKDFVLVIADPEEFGEGEVGQGGVGGELDETLIADLFGEPVALGLGTLIAPDEGGAEDGAGGVEHDTAMHLAGEADGFDGRGVARGSGGFECALNGELRGAPPVFGVLLGPADVLGVNGGVVGGV